MVCVSMNIEIITEFNLLYALVQTVIILLSLGEDSSQQSLNYLVDTLNDSNELLDTY